MRTNILAEIAIDVSAIINAYTHTRTMNVMHIYIYIIYLQKRKKNGFSVLSRITFTSL